MTNKSGFYLVLEGVDFTGKSTLATELVKSFLKKPILIMLNLKFSVLKTFIKILDFLELARVKFKTKIKYLF